ncbi:restriction endonuclease subunit S [Methylomagnum ishizawai]|uniref:restriction endonuclease subunit S n=1 Tax=Methylomagnum ishizawai TaxID=1760988 RepID=UPI001C339CAB|nr:restriction endonuclease subunit S [Methylomagnum ishizawai]BBL74212.1 type I restriction system specificity protein [Methylomagnum ishizawai]
MASEWHETPLEDCMEAIIDYRGKTPRKTANGIPLITAKIVKGGRINTPEEFIDPDEYDSWMTRGLPQAGDVVMTTEAPLGEVAQLDGKKVALAQRLITLRGKPGILDNTYLKFILQSDFVREQLFGRATGTTVIGIKQSELRKIKLPLAPFQEQRAIAQVLGNLDDKIELNRRMNATLEAMARALFKSWFVDFDPVRAKAEGREPEGLAPEIAALFPDGFEDSELGEIPAGWEAKNWGNLVSLEYGKSLKGYSEGNNDYPVYGTNGKIGTHSRPLCNHSGIIIGRKGAYRGVHYCSTPFFVIDTAFYVEPKKAVELRWAYYVLLGQDINSMDSGSAIPSTSREDFYSLPVLYPPFKIQAAFARKLAPLWAKQEQNDSESRALATLRDALLPKLLSGELRVLAVGSKLLNEVAA